MEQNKHVHNQQNICVLLREREGDRAYLCEPQHSELLLGKVSALLLLGSLLGGMVSVKTAREGCSHAHNPKKWQGGLGINVYGHYRVFCSSDWFLRGKNHINRTGNFQSFAKHRLARFNGYVSNEFVLHLEECGFWYSRRNEDLLPIVKNLPYCASGNFQETQNNIT